MRAKDILLENGRISEQEKFNINLTTLDRVLGFKVSKDALSITIDQGIIKFNNIESLEKVFRALNNVGVLEVYSSTEVKKFLEKTLGVSESKDSIKSTEKNKQKTKRSSAKDKSVIFGEPLLLKKSIVKDIYEDIVAIYSLYNKKQKGFVEILGFSLRLLLDVAANEYYVLNPARDVGSKNQYKKFIKLLKDEACHSSDKNSLAIDLHMKNIIEGENVAALLSKLAHGNMRAHIDLILGLSVIIGPLLKKYFSDESTSDIS